VAARIALGVTGDVGSGKSAVLAWLAARGAATLDADRVVAELLARDGHIGRRVEERFGPGVRAPGGGMNHARLAAIVFGDAGALRDLERIVHPAVWVAVERWLAAAEPDVGRGVAAVEAVKLVESGLHERMDVLWLVLCDRAERRQRLRARGWSRRDVDRRLAASGSLAPKLALASAVVDNSGPPRAMEAQLQVAWRRLTGGVPTGEPS
jgi:dephospho-CoA kinase